MIEHERDSPTVDDVPEIRDEAVEQLHRQLIIDQRAACVAGGIILVLAVIFRTNWGLLLGALILVMTAVRLPAFAALRRNDLVIALRWVAIGTWGVSIAVVSIVPDAFPIMVLNLIGPLISTAIYLGSSEMRKMTVAAIAVSVALALLGFRSEGTSIEDAVSEWFFQAILIGYLAAHVVITAALVTDANRVRLATLHRALASNVELVRTHAELEASRARVVAAGDQERVRIERNIHDGAQQRLVALAVQLKLASQLNRSGTPTGADALDDLHDATREAIDELRELARGIYPSILAERGLADALHSLAKSAPNDVGVDCPTDLDLESEPAAAIYFICAEALQNVAKHAVQAAALVRVERKQGGLDVTISDDGAGFDTAVAATSRGLLNMADRVGALGGTIEVSSRPGAGSQIHVHVPTLGRANLSP